MSKFINEKQNEPLTHKQIKTYLKKQLSKDINGLNLKKGEISIIESSSPIHTISDSDLINKLKEILKKGNLSDTRINKLFENNTIIDEFKIALTDWSYYIDYYSKKDVSTTNTQDYEIYDAIGTKIYDHICTLHIFKKNPKITEKEITEDIKQKNKLKSKFNKDLGLNEFIRYKTYTYKNQDDDAVIDTIKQHKIREIKMDLSDNTKNDIFKSVIGFIEYFIDNILGIGIGFAVVSNILNRYLDKEQTDPDKDYVSQLKEKLQFNKNCKIIYVTEYKQNTDKTVESKTTVTVTGLSKVYTQTSEYRDINKNFNTREESAEKVYGVIKNNNFN
jgi:dsRNA-specific ribonuclease